MPITGLFSAVRIISCFKRDIKREIFYVFYPISGQTKTGWPERRRINLWRMGERASGTILLIHSSQILYIIIGRTKSLPRRASSHRYRLWKVRRCAFASYSRYRRRNTSEQSCQLCIETHRRRTGQTTAWRWNRRYRSWGTTKVRRLAGKQSFCREESERAAGET